MQTISVIIPLWNGEKWIRACLSSLDGQDDGAPFALEVVVVDNGSHDKSPALVEDEFPAARLIRNGRNLGFAGGCNVGLAAATGGVLVLLNQDTQVRPGWLAALVAALTEPGVGVAGSLAAGPPASSPSPSHGRDLVVTGTSPASQGRADDRPDPA